MVPTVFATGFAMFSGKQRALIPATLGMVSTLAPTLGPTIGGWITDSMSWHWLFFINIIPGTFIAIALPLLGKVDEPNLGMLKRIDWLHVASLAIFLGCMQYVLEEGPRYQWFEDQTIETVAWVSFVGLARLPRALVLFGSMPVVQARRLQTPQLHVREHSQPGHRLRPLQRDLPARRSSSASVRGYDSFEIGTTVFVSGIFMAFGAPLAARLTTVLDQRLVISIGFHAVCAASSMLAVLRDHRGLGILGIAAGAGGARLRDPALHRSLRRHGAERRTARRTPLRVGPVQSHAQSGRRDRHRERHDMAAGLRPHPRRTLR